jgi:hypothetical protein
MKMMRQVSGMQALSVRQPFAELILRGVKTREYRSTPTRRIGERFYLYATKGGAKMSAGEMTAPKIWSADLSVPADAALPAWMVALAEELMRVELPRGLIVGTAVIAECSGPVEPKTPGGRAYYHWHLADVERLADPVKPTRHPQPVWFRPF